MLELSEEDVLGAGGLMGWAPLSPPVKFLDCKSAPPPTPPEDSAWSPWARGGSEAPTANQLSNPQFKRPQIQKKNQNRKESGTSGW